MGRPGGFCHVPSAKPFAYRLSSGYNELATLQLVSALTFVRAALQEGVSNVVTSAARFDAFSRCRSRVSMEQAKFQLRCS